MKDNRCFLVYLFQSENGRRRTKLVQAAGISVRDNSGDEICNADILNPDLVGINVFKTAKEAQAGVDTFLRGERKGEMNGVC